MARRVLQRPDLSRAREAFACGRGEPDLRAVPPTGLVASERDRLGIASLAVDEESSLHVSKLPMLHGDPFDRLLVAQAIVHGLIILTPDPIVARYRRGRCGSRTAMT